MDAYRFRHCVPKRESNVKCQKFPQLCDQTIIKVHIFFFWQDRAFKAGEKKPATNFVTWQLPNILIWMMKKGRREREAGQAFITWAFIHIQQGRSKNVKPALSRRTQNSRKKAKIILRKNHFLNQFIQGSVNVWENFLFNLFLKVERI